MKMAYFKQLKTKHWQVQIRRYGIKALTKTFPNRDDAKKWARLIESEIDRGIYVSRYEAEHITFAELVKRYQKEVTPHKKSASREMSRLKCLNKFFGELTLAKMNSEIVASFRDERLSLNLSGATVVKDLNTLSHIIDTAIKEWGYYLPFNPVKNIRKPKVSNSRSRRLSNEEQVILLAQCRKHSLMMESVVIFAIETAMRLGEIINLSWSEIDLERKIATLLLTKSGEVRQVPLSTLAIQSIKCLPRHIESSKVFWRWKTVSGFESSWQRVLSNSNLLNFRFHDLRHEATSRMFEKGFSLAEVATISGHKTWSMLRRYTHLKAEDLVKKLA